MSFAQPAYESPKWKIAAEADANERADFITKTYIHLVGAVGVFVFLESILINTGLAERLLDFVGVWRFGWLIFLGLFMFVSWIADSWARSATSPGMQYAGLGLYVVAESVIFAPILYMASSIEDQPNIILSAGAATLGLFAVLTVVVFVTRKDFSFLRSILVFGGVAAFGLIACSIIFGGFLLGPVFTYAMIALACGYILYSTSNVLHHYRIGQHVAASLALFAAVALLFWYIIQLFMSRD